MVRSHRDRVEIIFLYGECGRSFKATARRFNELYPDRPTDHKYISDLVKRFTETLSVKDKPRSGRKKSDEGTVVEILGRVNINCQQSLREIAKESGVPKSCVQRILKQNSFYPYKLHFTQELVRDDFDRRIEFCEVMCGKISQDPNLLRHICFSDESTFFLNGAVNIQNVRFWCTENPHEFRDNKTQYPKKINVWAGILGNSIIGPLFLQTNLNGDLYLEMLQDAIDPLITEVVENSIDYPQDEKIEEEKVVFQQDGCPAHYKKKVREYLDQHYPRRWIGRRGFVEWPPRSPDLAPNDFFLWGYLKSKVFRQPVASINELKERIVDACRQIPPQTFQAVRDEFHNRLFYCQEVNGAQFEHLLK